MPLSKTQVDKLGERLRQPDVPTDDDLRLLTEFREERRGAMDVVGAGLAELLGTVPARRLKTINSIVDKLRRESARLSQVQDIAGLRVVRDMTRADQDALADKVVARFAGARISDRRLRPSHGYRAVHVIVTVDRHLVEVQVRTELQHRWAMLVEHLARDWGQQVKYGQGPDLPEARIASGVTRRFVVDQLALLAEAIDLYEQGVVLAAEESFASDHSLVEMLGSARASVIEGFGVLAGVTDSPRGAAAGGLRPESADDRA